jgi:hypothetical protein
MIRHGKQLSIHVWNETWYLHVSIRFVAYFRIIHIQLFLSTVPQGTACVKLVVSLTATDLGNSEGGRKTFRNKTILVLERHLSIAGSQTEPPIGDGNLAIWRRKRYAHKLNSLHVCLQYLFVTDLKWANKIIILHGLSDTDETQSMQFEENIWIPTNNKSNIKLSTATGWKPNCS